MKKEDYQLCRLKHKLRKLKERRVKEVEWKLTKEEKQYIENLGYQVTPYLYEIRTKTFKDLSNIKYYKIREIHYSNKRGKKTIVRRLQHNDMKMLEEFNVKFYPVKFKIQLVS